MRDLEPETSPNPQSEIVTEEPLRAHSRTEEDGTGVPHQAIAEVHPDERPWRDQDLRAAAEVQRKRREAQPEPARERRREDQDAGKRLRRRAEGEEPRSHFHKRPDAPQLRAGRHTEEPLDATAAERSAVGKIARIEADFRFSTDQRQI